MGLVNQLGSFSPHIAAAATPLRDLLRPRNEWCWSAHHGEAFKSVKSSLASPPILAHFDASLPTKLETDASRIGGFGFILRQRHGETWKLVQCGSRFLSDAESRYAVIELEMAALVWAAKKCTTYLRGLPHFEVVTDHRPLLPILNHKYIGEIENIRLQRMRQKLVAFNFTCVWQRDTAHSIADALSGSLLHGPAEGEGDEDPLRIAVVASLSAVDETGTRISPLQDATLTRIRAAARNDPEYLALRNVILTGFPDHAHCLEPETRPYWRIRDMLAVVDDVIVYGPRLLIPRSLRRETLERLHDSHQGMERTKQRARQCVYWPGIDNDIENIVTSCSACHPLLSGLPREPLHSDDAPPTRVFESVSADYFHVAGRTFLVYADRLSGWPYVFSCTTPASSSQLVSFLRKLFADTGVPTVLRTDGGPQFTSSRVRSFLTRWGVEHRISSPHYPQSNGHAEAAVKVVKKLLLTTTQNGDLDNDAFARGLLELRNTPRGDGRSPSQVLFGHPLRSSVPTHYRSFSEEWQKAAAECEAKAEHLRQQAKDRYDSTTRTHSQLIIGTHVDVYNLASRHWDRLGVIVGVGSRRDYLVKLGSGRTWWRNRRFLRPHRPFLTCATACDTRFSVPSTLPPAPQDDKGGTSQPAPLRRSGRQRREPSRLAVRWGATSYE